MEKFEIRTLQIYIYGAGSLGITLLKTLNSSGINVKGFFDKRSDVIKSVKGISILSLEDAAKIEYKENCMVILAIRNVFEHSQLAAYFYKIGYDKIIFKPTSVLNNIGNETMKQISEAYDCLMSDFKVPDYKIPLFQREKIYLMEDSALIPNKKDENYVYAYLPGELLFSNTLINSIWSERNFMANYPGVDLYQEFGRASSDFTEVSQKYIDRFAFPGAITMGVSTDGNWSDILIDSRISVYNEMKNKEALTPDFFIDNATTVGIRKSGGFRLIASGKNRVSFLIAQGKRFIPVKISKTDYEYYINLEITNKIISILENDMEPLVFAPIPHPYFYNYGYSIPQYMEQWGVRVAHFLCEQVYLRKKVFEFQDYCIEDYSHDNGTISRYLKMIGFSVNRMMDDSLLTTLLDELLRIPMNVSSKRKSTSKQENQRNTFAKIFCDIEYGNSLVDVDGCEEFIFILSMEEHKKSSKILKEKGYFQETELLQSIWGGKKIRGTVYRKEIK